MSTLPAASATYASAWRAPSPMAGSAAFDPTNSRTYGYATTAEINVQLVGGNGGSGALDFDMKAPDGQTFQPGRTYAGDDVYGVRGWGEVSNGTTCDGVAFTIVDIASSGTSVTRLDMTYRTACPSLDGGYAFGQLLFGEPAPVPGAVVSADRLQWPTVPVGATSPAVAPVRIRNTGTAALPLSSARIGGAAAADYQVVGSTCGPALAAGAGCVLSVAFTPHATDDRPAVLRGTVGATTVAIALDGLAPPGRTLFRASSQPGDWVGRGKKYLLTDAQQPFLVTADSTEFTAVIGGPDNWVVRVIGPHHGPFTLGTHAADESDPSRWYLAVAGDGDGCANSVGTVTVRQVTLAADGTLAAFDATFVQHCDTLSAPALSGEIAYRATTPVPAPPAAPFTLRPGASLAAGGSLVATWANQPAYRLTLTRGGDLRLTVSDGGAVLWDSHTSGTGTALTMRPGGNLVLADGSGRVLWATGTKVPGSFAVLQSNGDLVVDNPSYQPVYRSGTAPPIV